jgi:HPt (histidine-containing phosphotransfer) domain-containing protein
MEAGADAFLPKPIEAMRLLQQIHALCAAPAGSAPAPQPAAASPRPAAAGPATVINMETLGHLEELGSSANFVERLIGVFLGDNTALLRRAEQAIASRNYQEFRAVLHAMKGSSASMGTDRLTESCSGLDKLSDAELRLQSPVLLRSLTREIEDARGELERYLRDGRRSAG